MHLLLAPLLLSSLPQVSVEPRRTTPRGEEQRATFRDEKEVHQLVFLVTTHQKEDQRSLRMKVEHSARSIGAKKWTTVWEAKDFVEACEFDVELSPLEKSISVTDADGDGELELAFAYTLGCYSDVSPLTMKLLMYEGKAKYALRGLTKVVEPMGPTGGTYEVDPAFDKVPKLLEAAKALWTKVVPVAHAAPTEEPPGTKP